MENSPVSRKDDSEKKDTGKKKKRARELGVFAIEPKQVKSDQPKDTEDIWQKLSLTKRRGGISEAAVPLSEITETVAAATPEVSETEAPLEVLSPSERQFVAHEIIDSQPKTATDYSAETAMAATEAIELFRHKVVAENQDVEQAFEETMQSVGGEPESSEDTETPNLSAADTQPSRVVSNRSTSPPTALSHENRLLENFNDDTTDRPPLSRDTGGAGSPPGGTRRIDGAGAGDSYSFIPPASAAPAAKTEKEYIPYYNNEDVVGAALLGGLIGYLIGRRRGRIKTERKLRPIQKKLEKQVKDLQADIVSKEFQIRKVANQQAQEKQREQRSEYLDDAVEHRVKAPEANQLHGKKVLPESIGHVIVTAEDKPATKADKRLEMSAEDRANDRRSETMSRSELLDLSEKITVENTTLRQVYETHLVSEQGLRHLVDEYIHGGDVQKALREELVEHAIDFERDPILRDRKRPKSEAGPAATETLSALLQKADVLSEAKAKDELAVLKARQKHHEAQGQQRHSRRRIMDTSMVVAIIVLFVLVVMLLLRGG